MHWPVELLGEAIRSSGIQGDEIKAVGITGSTGTVLPIGAGGMATGPVILWYDSRARSAVSELTARLSADRFAQLTGVPLDHMPVVSKILWFRAEHPDAFASTAVFAHPQTAVLRALTGSGWFCDECHGPYFGLMDLEARNWSDELLAAAGLQPELLPQLVAPGTVVGTPSSDVASKTGLNPRTQVVAAGADASCFTLGAGVEGTGTASAYIGTAGVVGVVTDRPVRDRRLTCTPSALPGHWDVQGLLMTGGSAYKWLRTLLSDCTGSTGALGFEDLNAMAAGVPPGSDGVIVVPHFAGAGSPLWNPEAGGMIV
jgi:sugar (pentulose or hexulose) kinase